MVFHWVSIGLLNNESVSRRSVSGLSSVHLLDVTLRSRYTSTALFSFFTVYIVVAWPDIRYVTDLEPHTNVAQI